MPNAVCGGNIQTRKRCGSCERLAFQVASDSRRAGKLHLPRAGVFSTLRGMSTNNNRFGCLGVFIVVLLCLSLLVNAAFLFTSFLGLSVGTSEQSKFKEVVVTKPAGNAKSKVAIIPLKGLITNYLPGSVGASMVDDFKIQLRRATEDNDVKAIVIAIDSPGGEVTASDIMYQAVKKAKAVKPVVISMGALAASGGYYVAIAGSYLFANETTFTGSIGVIMQTYNYEGLFEKVGLKAVTYKSGAFKDMMSGARPVTPEEKQYIEELVEQTYSRFVGLVAKERNIDEQTLRKGQADGRIISGKGALDGKLIDSLGDLDAAVLKAMELGKAPGSAVVRYAAPEGLLPSLLMGKAEQSKKIEINLTPAQTLPLEPGYFYLLPAHMAP
jgi:protease IV